MNNTMHHRHSATTSSRAGQGNQDRRGATCVEFALVTPIFLLTLIASFEFSRMYLLRHTADNAAYEAARHIIVPGAKAREARRKARNLLRAVGARRFSISITPGQIDEDTEEVTVTVTLEYHKNAYFLPRVLTDLTIRSSSTLMTERYKIMP